MSRERPRWPRSVRLIARGHAGMSGARSEANALAGVRAWVRPRDLESSSSTTAGRFTELRSSSALLERIFAV
jgi:hypothetical protein